MQSRKLTEAFNGEDNCEMKGEVEETPQLLSDGSIMHVPWIIIKVEHPIEVLWYEKVKDTLVFELLNCLASGVGLGLMDMTDHSNSRKLVRG